MEIEIIRDARMYGCCPTAIRHANDAGHTVVGVAVITLPADGGYDAEEVDTILSHRLKRPCGTFGEGDEDEAGHYITPIITI